MTETPTPVELFVPMPTQMSPGCANSRPYRTTRLQLSVLVKSQAAQERAVVAGSGGLSKALSIYSNGKTQLLQWKALYHSNDFSPEWQAGKTISASMRVKSRTRRFLAWEK